ncbi:tyrosine-protein phosphatase [Embleya hyalina]|uniref:Protein-tyrosine-phosphatase n=1 Tax=Embleya hyalina TaxID=516124 RepID=A0A401YPA8_9ACTN|nr:tyrosine-protein phosphatase [Embleya hyalina]GCD96425.1 protein-tyrosine-phosphatase [Embleya hyalina]
MNRRLDLPDLLNARDVGDLPLIGGGVTRTGVLMRSETPDLLTPEGVDRLIHTYRVRHVLDLRSDHEGLPPTEWAGVVRHRLPLLGRRSALAADRAAIGDVSAGQTQGLGLDDDIDLGSVDEFGAGLLYMRMAERGGESYVRSLEVLAGDGGVPALVHCTAGKDRTGILVALLLSVAGVEREAIIADYTETETHLVEMFERIDRLPRQPRIDPSHPVAPAMRGAARASIDTFLRVLEERHGSAAEFLLKAGAAPDHLESWRRTIRGGTG